MSQRLWPKHNDNDAFDIMYSKAGVFHKLEKNWTTQNLLYINYYFNSKKESNVTDRQNNKQTNT